MPSLPRAADELVVGGGKARLRLVDNGAVAEIDRDLAGAGVGGIRAVVEGIVAGAAGERVVAGAAGERVVAGPPSSASLPLPPERVVAVAARERVVARAAVERVVAVVAGEVSLPPLPVPLMLPCRSSVRFSTLAGVCRSTDDCIVSVPSLAFQ